MALFGRESERDQQRAEAWARWFRKQHPFALASLVLGVFSLIEFGALLIFGIAGIVAGVIALAQLRRAGRTEGASGDPDQGAARRDVGPVAYAPPDSPPPIRALDYEDVREPVRWSEGARLAWGGIVTSVLSLILAALLYLRVFG